MRLGFEKVMHLFGGFGLEVFFYEQPRGQQCGELASRQCIALVEL